jgi:comEA protein
MTGFMGMPPMKECRTRMWSKGGREMKEMGSVLVALILFLGVMSTVSAETGKKIDLNAASQRQLESLPGIGPALADRIVKHREKNGNFKRIEELMNVKGIGEKKFLRLRDLIAVNKLPPESTPKKN